MPRTPVQEQIEAALETVQRQTAAQVASGDFGGEPVYIENCLQGKSRFTHRTLGTFLWESTGYEESIQQVPPALLRDGAFRRRLNTKKFKQLSGEQVDARLEELKPLPGTENEDINRIHKALAEGASERSSRYAVDNLPDQGFEKGQITPEQTWGDQPQTVRRSGTKPMTVGSQAEATVMEVPLPAEVVIGEKVHEGQWQSDTGA